MIEPNQKHKLKDEDLRYFIAYINDVVHPSSKEFNERLTKNELELHQAFSFNAILAHAIDYMVFLASKTGRQSRAKFIKEFDEKYSVDGSTHINNKFRLLDAVNNSFKHVELDRKRYKDLIEKYGKLSFSCLSSIKGKVYFETPNFKFDYGRVILRPIKEIFNIEISDSHAVTAFINGKIYGCSGQGAFIHEYEPWDAIDRMIEYCGAPCIDCGESDNCECSDFRYGEQKGKFTPDVDPRFNLDDVMSQISGTREWSK